jgi:DNA repair protein RadC
MVIKLSKKAQRTKTDNSKALAEIFHKILKAEPEIDRMKEHFWGLYFDARDNIVRIELIGLGILDAQVIHPRETFRPAIESSAYGVVVAHNHPSGDIEPSNNDIEVTERLEKAAEILGFTFRDHIIINEKGEFYSFKDKRLI